MCRHLAYLGPPVSLASLVLEPEHGLLVQSYAPRHQAHGLVNADGFGVGWYADGRAEPARHRRNVPIWTDQSFASWAPVVSSGALVAAVRSATPGSPIDESCAAPFLHGPWLFSHNGRLDGYDGEPGRYLRSLVADTAPPEAHAPVDSTLLFALAVRELDRGVDLTKALAVTVATVREVTTGRVSLLLTDGVRIAAAVVGESLVTRRTADSVVVASEPYDDEAGWEPVPDGMLVDAAPGHVAHTPL